MLAVDTAKYDADQPRDDRGRWSRDAARVASLAAQNIHIDVNLDQIDHFPLPRNA